MLLRLFDSSALEVNAGKDCPMLKNLVRLFSYNYDCQIYFNVAEAHKLGSKSLACHIALSYLCLTLILLYVSLYGVR